MKQYELLKDLPGIKTGTVSETTTGALHSFMGNEIRLGFAENFILSYPDWFKLIEPKEFTESQVRKAVRDFISLTYQVYEINAHSDNLDKIINDLRK